MEPGTGARSIEALEQEIARLKRELEEQEATSDALRRSEARYRGYFDAGTVGMATTSVPDRRWVEVNDAVCEMLGYSREEILQKTWAELTHPDDVALNIADVNLVLTGKQDSFTAEKRYRHKSGRYIDAILRTRGLRGPDGSVEYFVSFIQDISVLKTTERALRASQQATARHFDQTMLAMIEFTVTQHITAWNPAAELIFGYKREEIVGQLAAVLVPEEARRHVEDLFLGLASRSEESRHSINANVTRDGRTIVCEWFNTTLTGEHGEVVGISSMVQDVTARVQAEGELRQHLATIERQQQAIRRLSLPIIEVWEGVLAVPVVGVLDHDRAADMMGRLTERIAGAGARIVVIDLTGVEAVDADSASHLGRILAAAKLLGAATMVTGIRPKVAQTIVASGIDFSGVATRRTLQDALRLCVRQRVQ